MASLSVTPSYIDIVATNTVNSQTYTIAGNQSVDATQTIVWDTSEYTQTTDLPFVIATYTLMVGPHFIISRFVANSSGLRRRERSYKCSSSRLPRSLQQLPIWHLHSATLHSSERIQMRYLQRSHVSQRKASPQSHTRNMHTHNPVFHVVCVRCLPTILSSYNSTHAQKHAADLFFDAVHVPYDSKTTGSDVRLCIASRVE